MHRNRFRCTLVAFALTSTIAVVLTAPAAAAGGHLSTPADSGAETGWPVLPGWFARAWQSVLATPARLGCMVDPGRCEEAAGAQPKQTPQGDGGCTIDPSGIHCQGGTAAVLRPPRRDGGCVIDPNGHCQ